MRKATTTEHGLGWKKDKHDARDYHYLPEIPAKDLPKRVDLRPFCPPVYNQKRLNSCCANSVAAAVEYDLMKQKHQRVIFPSRLFLYYNVRAIEGTVRENVGAYVRDAIKSVAQNGDCPESLWPYVEKKFRRKPSPRCYSSATKYDAVEYRRIHRKMDDFRSCLASGYPFVFGFLVHQRFRDVVNKTGVLEMPRRGEHVLGGHAVLAVGYDHPGQRFIVRNSWGPKFGLGGYFMMPYEYFLKKHLTDDFWTIRVVS